MWMCLLRLSDIAYWQNLQVNCMPDNQQELYPLKRVGTQERVKGVIREGNEAVEGCQASRITPVHFARRLSLQL